MKVIKQGDKVVMKGRVGKGKFSVKRKLEDSFEITDRDIQEVENLLQPMKVGIKSFTQQELDEVDLDFGL